MTITMDSLNSSNQVKQGSIIIKQNHIKDSILHLENNLSLSKENNISDNTGKHIEIKNYNIGQTLLIGKIDSSNTNSLPKSISIESWNNIISVNNKVYKLISKKREIYIINRNSEISSISKLFQESPHLNKDSTAMNNTILILLITSFVLLAWVKISFSKYLTQLLRALINYSDEAKLYTDHNTIIDRLYLLLNSVFTITGGLFIYFFLKYIGIINFSISPFLILFGCLGIIISIYIYRYSINKVFGFVFYQNQAFNEYLHSAFIYYKAMGLFLLPLICVIYILSEKYRIGILLIGTLIIFVLYFISVFKATKIMLQKGILLFYWILYLCTVEFLPIILIYKFLSFGR